MTSTPRLGSTIVRFVASLAGLVGIAVVVPLLLVAAARRRFGGAAPWHGVSSPTDWEWRRVRSALTDQLTDDTLADIVVRLALVVAWSAVVVLVVTVAVEVAHMSRHQGLAMPTVRGLGIAQPLARAIAAGLLVVVPTISSSPAALARGAAGSSPSAVPMADVATEAAEVADAVPPESGTSDVVRHVVGPGDSVYGIAARHVGPDPDAIAAYADRVLELNLGRRMNDGSRFDNPALIDVGWVLDVPVVPSGSASSGSVPSAPVPDEVAGEGPADVVHLVERGETLWSIADDELGDPERWPEIYAANAGRRFVDGGQLDDPSLIRPGWELLVPGLVPSPTDQPDVVTDTVTDTVSDEPAPSGAEVAVPSDRAVGADAVDDGAGVQDRPMVESTDTDAPVVGDDPRPTNRWTATSLPTGSAAPAAAPAAAPDPARITAPGTAASDESGPQLLTLGRAAMLSAGVLALVGVRRRQRLRGARPRAALPTTSAHVAITERALRSIDDGDRFLRVDIGVRAVARRLVEAGERVLAVTVDDAGAIEVVSTGPVGLDPPWTNTDEAHRWRLAASVPVEILAEEARQVGSPCPTLVQLGRTLDGRDLYVDLEAVGAIDVGGPGDLADAIVNALAATLAASVLAEVTTFVALGIDDAAFLGHRHRLSARDVADAFRLAATAVGPVPTGGRSTFELRALATGGEAWEPAVVLVGSASGPVQLPADRTGLAIVSASPTVGPSSRLEPDGDAWILRPLGVRFTPVGLPTHELAALSALVASADAALIDEPAIERVEGVPAIVAGRDHDDDLTLVPTDDRATDTTPDVAPPAPPPFLVRLLGPVEVVAADGRIVDFERSKSKELVAWLATHRERSTRTAARTALWELDVRDATFANVVSEARRTLARFVEPPVGDEWVGRTLTEALPLHESIRTDADVVRAALVAARLQPPTQAIATLAPAVDLVAGMPFEGTTYLWPESEGLASELVLLATSAAAELAAHYLSMGDVDGVFESTGRGLRVLPGHEELIGLRMRAHARRGDRAGVRLEWEQYERVITADPWSDGEPSETLVELRRELLAG